MSRTRMSRTNLTKPHDQAFLKDVNHAEYLIKQTITKGVLNMAPLSAIRKDVERIVSECDQALPKGVIDRESYLNGLRESAEAMIRSSYKPMERYFRKALSAFVFAGISASLIGSPAKAYGYITGLTDRQKDRIDSIIDKGKGDIIPIDDEGFDEITSKGKKPHVGGGHITADIVGGGKTTQIDRPIGGDITITDTTKPTKPDIKPTDGGGFVPDTGPDIIPQKPGEKPDITPKPKPDGKPDFVPKPDETPRPKPDFIPDDKPDITPKPRPDFVPDDKPDGKPDLVPDDKPDGKPKPEKPRKPKKPTKPDKPTGGRNLWGEAKGYPNVSDYEKKLKEYIGGASKFDFAPSSPGKRKITIWQKAELDIRHKAQLEMLDDLRSRGVRYAWASSHPDCSERCERWQGKLFDISSDSDRFLLGKLDGIEVYSLKKVMSQKDQYGYENNIISGFNCRHYLIPYEKGVKPVTEYSAEEVARERMTNSELRSYERKIRQLKNKAGLMAQIDVKESKRIMSEARKLTAEYKQFAEKNGYAWFQYRI